MRGGTERDSPTSAIGTSAPVIGVLGPVSVNSRPVAGIRARRLVAALALADGRTVSAARLIDEIWGNDPPATPTAALQTQISRLRAQLQPGAVEASGAGYRLTNAQTDLALAEDAAANGRSAEGLALWRGIAGDDLGEGELSAELARRSDRVRRRLEDLHAHEALKRDDFALARSLAQRRVDEDPLDEPSRVLLMRALAGEHRIAEALAAYAELRRVLADELGVEPGEQARAVHARLLADGESEEVIEVASRPAPAVGLPAETTPLIGRDSEIVELRALLDEHRVVTVLGPGGVGKTSIGEVTARSIADDGVPVYYVRLASIRADADVVAAVAGVFGVAETELGADGRPRRATRDLRARLLGWLGERHCLIVLDNCEQVIDGCATLVADIVSTAPAVTVLATSRSPLQIRAEWVHPLPVLGTSGVDSAAVELFRQRARAVRPDADLDPDAVANLCRRLDGLPLAIELAAARVRTLSVEQITERLQERFALLRSRDRTTPDRHRTLHAVIEWSWELLDEESQLTLRRLCRFPAGFDTGAAQQVSGLSQLDLDEALTSLANQSLLHVSDSAGRARYRMLETVREFGDEMLRAPDADPDESERVDSAMADWARTASIEIWSQYRTGSTRAALDRLRGDFENLLFVLRHAVDRLVDGDAEAVPTVTAVFPPVAGGWAMRGQNAQIGAWGGQIIGALPLPPAQLSDDERERWQALVLMCCSDVMTTPVSRHVARGRMLARMLHRPRHTLDRPADFATALLLSRSMLGVYRTVLAGTGAAESEVRVPALGLRMNIRENNGDLRGALADSMAIRAEMPHADLWVTSLVAMTTSSIYGQQARWEEAARGYRSAVNNLVMIGAESDVGQARGYLIGSLCCLGRIDEAREQYALLSRGWTPALADPQGEPEVIATMMLDGAEIARLTGAPDADLYARAARVLIERLPKGARDPGSEMLLSAALLGVLECDGDPAVARELASALVVAEPAMFGANGYWDLPQAATMALAVGGYLCRIDADSPLGHRLIHIAVRLRARQDYPVMHAAVQRSLDAPVDARIRSLARARAVELLRETIDEVKAAGLVD